MRSGHTLVCNFKFVSNRLLAWDLPVGHLTRCTKWRGGGLAEVPKWGCNTTDQASLHRHSPMHSHYAVSVLGVGKTIICVWWPTGEMRVLLSPWWWLAGRRGRQTWEHTVRSKQGPSVKFRLLFSPIKCCVWHTRFQPLVEQFSKIFYHSWEWGSN